MKRRTEITIETHEVTVISTSRDNPSNRYCPSCGSHVNVWPASQVAGFWRETDDEVLHGVSENRLHLTEPRAPDDLFCANSPAEQKGL